MTSSRVSRRTPQKSTVALRPCTATTRPGTPRHMGGSLLSQHGGGHRRLAVTDGAVVGAELAGHEDPQAAGLEAVADRREEAGVLEAAARERHRAEPRCGGDPRDGVRG